MQPTSSFRKAAAAVDPKEPSNSLRGKRNERGFSFLLLSNAKKLISPPLQHWREPREFLARLPSLRRPSDPTLTSKDSSFLVGRSSSSSSRLMKRRRASRGRGIDELWRREVGDCSPLSFIYRVGAAEDLVLRLALHKKLDRHRGCVNTVSFNAGGDILVSGSDDRMVFLWDWDAGLVKLTFHSGHVDNVFQAKLMPFSEDRNIVTCAADGQVRHARIREGGCVDTENLGKHQGRVHKLAIEPGSPHIFYSCGEDGLVQHFDLRTQAATELLTCQPFHDKSRYMPVVSLNAIAMDPRKPNLFAVAGSDEYARLYDIRRYKLDASTSFGCPVDCFCPQHLIGDDRVGITGLAFSDQSELLVSYNDELIYLFSMDLGLGPDPLSRSQSSSGSVNGSGPNATSELPSDQDSGTRSGPQVYEGHRNCDTVKGVSFFGPNCKYVASGSDCGRIFIWRKRGGELLRVMEGDRRVVNCIEPHPHAAILATSGIEHNVKIWTPIATEPSSLPVNLEEIKERTRKHTSRFANAQDVITHIFPLLRRHRSNSGRRRGEWPEDADVLEYVMTFAGGSGDDASDDSSGNSENPGDCSVL